MDDETLQWALARVRELPDTASNRPSSASASPALARVREMPEETSNRALSASASPALARVRELPDTASSRPSSVSASPALARVRELPEETSSRPFSAPALPGARAPARTAGIGTLGERTLHAALKYACEPDDRLHEVRVGRYIADIARPDGIIEVQTGSFYPLRAKLAAFLAKGPVTVVHPVAVHKTLVWVDPATGEVSAPRKSPRTGTLCDLLPELFWLRGLLDEPGLCICAVLLDVTDYRLKNGWSADGKKGSSRCERIPVRVLGEVRLREPCDYAALLPAPLPAAFTAAEFGRAARLRGKKASAALQVLQDRGVLRRAGTRGRAFLYEKTTD